MKSCIFSKCSFLRMRCLMTASGSLSKTHYEVLGVEKNCTTKEIKDAYVKLCKQYHPDRRPNDANQHRKFIQLNEAYMVLVRPEMRHIYDSDLSSGRSSEKASSSSFYQDENTQFRQPFDNRYPSYEYYRHYYGVDDDEYYQRYYYEANKLHRQKIYIVFGCLILMIFGTVFHYFTFTLGTTLSEKRMDEKDKRLLAAYTKIRKNAIDSKDENQMKEFLDGLKRRAVSSEDNKSKVKSQ